MTTPTTPHPPPTAQAAAVAADLAALAAPDVDAPFASLEDAVRRLLPYHVRGLMRRVD